MTSTVPAKSQSLHNFALPHLKWNNNHPRGGRSSSSPSSSNIDATSINNIDNKSIDKESRSKILIKIPSSMRSSGNNKLKEEVQVSMNEEKGEGEDDEVEGGKIWNLRPRRGIKKLLGGNCVGVGLKGGGGVGLVAEKKEEVLEKENLEKGSKSRVNGGEKEKKVKFALSLTRREIEEDIYSLTGARAARRPRKRAKVVQKYLDNVFPGVWLGSVTPDLYKVSEHYIKG